MENTPVSPVPAPAHNFTWLWISIAIVLGAALGIGGYWYWNRETTIPTSDVVVTANTTIAKNTNLSINENTNTKSVAVVPTPNLAKVTTDVLWETPAAVVDATISLSSSSTLLSGDAPLLYYRLGRVKTGTYAGDTLYMATAGYNDPTPYRAQLRYVMHDGKRILLTKISDDYLLDGGVINLLGVDTARFTTDTKTTLPSFTIPAKLNGPKARQTLVRDEWVRDFFVIDGLTKAFTDKTYGDVYTKTTYTSTAGYGTNIGSPYNRNGYYLRLADGTLAVYKLESDIMKNSVPTITWTDGKINNIGYNLTDIGGCGGTNYASIIDPAVVNPETDLTKVGTTAQGDVIYGFKDTNHPFQKAYYDNVYQVFEGEKISYETFIAAHPIVFWYDPFGRLLKLQSNAYGPMAECGKPVIYLYPEKPTDVNVTLTPAGGFTLTEPDYGNGWHVTALPSGQLTDLRNGKNYPYLFWEGRGGLYVPPTKGFVVAQANVHGFLATSLTKLGLNAQELRDFQEFWEPRMTNSPWYFISFLGTSQMNVLAPLEISPKPETLIRILMDYQPLEQPIPTQEYPLTAPARKGFTVVEWGGVLR